MYCRDGENSRKEQLRRSSLIAYETETELSGMFFLRAYKLYKLFQYARWMVFVIFYILLLFHLLVNFCLLILKYFQ
jgi:hypothetical protein